ncbi:GL10755 [Drosophila persimilis]|uniref:GL10755 n=1 Tax=Drosophila persimilis TaxID=7234 RepID=B4GA81_DROPE|nr:GL10755 [Drosophila persimilis]
MPLTAESAAQQIQDRLKDIQQQIHIVDEERRRAENSISTLVRSLQTNNAKVKPLLKASMLETSQEEATIRAALAKIHEIRSIRNERRIQALCGAIPAEGNYVAKVGDNVAALAKGIDEEENWILAEVVQFLHRQNKYDVIDIDEEQKDRHVLSKRKVIPLPLMRANPETDGHALFPKDTVVMALYPQTTCFYKAIVHRLPATATEEYDVLFEDSSYMNGYAEPLPVAQRYVIAYRPTKKGAGSGSGNLSSA